jgi:Cd2+/Zn2+-exporting ATPase
MKARINTSQAMTTQKRQLIITGMDCAECAATLERGVSRLPGVETCEVNFAAARMSLSGDVPIEAVHARIRELGYDVDLTGAANSAQIPTAKPQGGIFGFVRFLMQRPNTIAAAIGALALGLGIAAQVVHAPLIVVDSLLLASLFIAGFPVARSGLRAALINRDININLLMTIAATGAVLIGELGEGAVTMCLFAIGEALEGYTTDQARRSIRSLMQLTPAEATVLRPCMDCQGHMGQDGYTGGPCPWCGYHEEKTPLDQVAVGDLILVKSGGRIPVDGRVRQGASGVNQAPITGESMPVEKTVGDPVYAGTINGEMALEIEVTHRAADSTVSRIIHMVEEAQAQKAPVQARVDRFARVYTPLVVLIAAVLAVAPPVLFNAPFLDVGDTHGWLYRALSLLVIACPCALVISTPVSIIGAITSAARRGVLVKGGAALETLGKVKAFAFDKTGTLTQGRPIVRKTVSTECREEAGVCEACNSLLALAASVERRAAHPLAQAIVSAAAERGVLDRLPAAHEVTTLAGRGVQGLVNGQPITVGSHRFFDSAYPHQEALCQQIQAVEAGGQTTMLVHDGQQVRGYITVDDPERVSSQATVAALRQLPDVQHIVMLTGDSPATASHIARMTGVDSVEANLLPEDKLQAIRKLVETYGTVAMVGDGINDTPALAAASIGIAMGGAGTAQALETADVALMGDDLTQLPYVVALSKQTHRVISENIGLSLGIKAVFLVGALFGLTGLWMAVLADMGTSLLVTFNGMRLLNFRR